MAVLLGGGGGLLAAIWGLGGSGKSRAPAPQAVPAGPPAQAPPEKATVIPVGGKPAAAGPAISMKCAACGHDFKAAATDVTAHFTRRLSDLYGGDIDKMLDKAQKDGGAGYPCPKCGRAAAAPDAAGMPDAAP